MTISSRKISKGNTERKISKWRNSERQNMALKRAYWYCKPGSSRFGARYLLLASPNLTSPNLTVDVLLSIYFHFDILLLIFFLANILLLRCFAFDIVPLRYFAFDILSVDILIFDILCLTD